MTSRKSPALSVWSTRCLLLLTLAVPERLWAQEHSQIADHWLIGYGTLLIGLAVGLLVWVGHRRFSQVQRRAAQMSMLIERPDCFVWEAKVELGKKDLWRWKFTLPASVLSEELSRAGVVTSGGNIWSSVTILEKAEMDARALGAMKNGLPGYEQQFQVIVDGKNRWMREIVSITPIAQNKFWLVGMVTDISVRKEVELSSRASQEQLQQLLAQANCMLWQAQVRRDEHGTFHWDWFIPSSDLYRRIVGEQVGVNVSMPWSADTVPEFHEIQARAREALTTGLSGYEQEFRVIMGGLEWWMHEQALITPQEKNHWKIQGVVIDVTARRRAEIAQQTSEKRLQHLLERADCSIWHGQATRTSDGRLLWNIFVPPSQLYRRIHGRDPGENGYFEWDRLEVPEYQEMAENAQRAMLAGAAAYDHIFHVPRADGAIWLSEQVTISPAGPDRWDLVGLITDITARHEAEEARRASDAQLQRILEMADCMVWQAVVVRSPDNHLSWTSYTPRSVLYRRIFGDEGEEGVLSWERLNVPEKEEMDRRSRAAILAGNGYEQEFRVVRDSDVVWLREVVTLAPGTADRVRLVGVVTDITAQREAREALRASEAQMEQLLATADCLLWQARVFGLAAGQFRWVAFIPSSRLHLEIFGVDATSRTELDWAKVVGPETLVEMNERASQALREDLPGYEQEFRAQRAERVFWLHEQVSVSRVSPTEWHLVGVITDITGRRGAEQAVRDSEVRYRSLFQHMPVAIVESDFTRVGAALDALRSEGVEDLAQWFEGDASRLEQIAQLIQVSDANDTALRLLRTKKRSDFQRRRNLLATTDTSRAIRAILLALWANENALEMQLEMRDFEGGVHHLNVRWWMARNADGLDLRQSLLVFVDVTGLKQVEAALATEKEWLAVTLRAMTEAVVTTNVEGRVQFMNPAAAAFTQWDDAAIGQPINQVCRLQNDLTGSTYDLPVMEVAHGDAISELPSQVRLVTRNGQHRLVAGCCAPIHSADGNVIGLVFVFRDVTEQERMEQELIRATRLESVGVLAGGIAHDFNNILTAVLGNIAMAQLDVESLTPAGKRLREAEKATLRARDLTQQLLTFAKGGEPVRAVVQLENVIQETTQFALHGSTVKAHFDFSPGLWPANADKGQISRVLQNLVINAVQAMPAGGNLYLRVINDRVTGGSYPGLSAGDYVQISVRDSGTGIPMSNLPRIFDPYFTTKKSGSGLGLAAVYSIIKKHRGHVEVESKVNDGTTFRIWLPAIKGTPVNTMPPMPLPENKFSGRVLFMDDEEVIRMMAALMLERLGFVVDCAKDGSEAIAKYQKAIAENNGFRLVIMDLTVPGGMGGRQALQRLREIDPKVRAIVSSGYSSDPVLSNFRTHGFCGVVAKPYKVADLVLAINEALSA